MKYVYTLLFSLLVTLPNLLWAQGTKNYTSDSLKFSIDVPQNWQLIDNYNAQVALVAIAPKRGAADNFSENINVVVDPTDLSGITAEHYRDLTAEALKTVLTAVSIDSLATDTLSDGKVAGIIAYTHKANNIKLKVITYLFVKDNKGYVITCTAKKENFINYLQQFTGIYNTFKLK
jgi:hypothetical protein